MKHFFSGIFAYHSYGFFSDLNNEDINVCDDFMRSIGFRRSDKIKLVVTARNPKRKEWSRVRWTDETHVTVNGKNFYMACCQRDFLCDLDLVERDFWLRVQKVS